MGPDPRKTAGIDHEQADWLNNYVFEELTKLAGFASARKASTSMETLNLVLLGCHAYGERFVMSSPVRVLLKEIDQSKLCYFSYVALKFAYNKSPSKYGPQLASLNDRAVGRVLAAVGELQSDTELYLLFCDLISSPDLDQDRKKALIDSALSDSISNGVIGPATDLVVEQISPLIGFTDWSGARLHHTLTRRQLRAGREY